MGRAKDKGALQKLVFVKGLGKDLWSDFAKYIYVHLSKYSYMDFVAVWFQLTETETESLN